MKQTLSPKYKYLSIKLYNICETKAQNVKQVQQ